MAHPRLKLLVPFLIGCLLLAILASVMLTARSDVQERVQISNQVLLNLPRILPSRKVTALSWNPRAFLYNGFLTEDECDQVIKIAGGDIARSEVVGEDGKTIVDSARTSYGTFISRHMTNPLIVDIENRIAEWVFLPRANSETFYLLRYEVGQEYKAHTDWFAPWDDSSKVLGSAGNRLVTVIIYLTDVEEGGETWFPNANLKVTPKKGDALMFWNQTPDHQLDPMAAHSSLPVIRGTKWSLTRWIRERSMGG